MEDRNAALDYVRASRVLLYSVFSRMFAEELDDRFCTLYDSDEVRAAIDLLLPDSSAESLLGLDLDGRVDDLKSEYVRLFLGPGAPEAAPWESLYVGSGGAVMGSVTLSVRTWFHRFGMGTRGYPHVPDDHIALELGFMAALIEQSAPVEMQKQFLDEHLLRWAGRFCEKVEQASPASPYAAFAKGLGEFLLRDRELLDSLAK